MPETFKIGDTVQLKSGGPLMTVEEFGEYNGVYKARCIWFFQGKESNGVYPPDTLVKVD
ncbi:MAG: DUF2158 domain-containing protein [Pseudooceanicola sp.]|nr:DUF2158 domain-containing protein [Pseudooceanicola sp.]